MHYFNKTGDFDAEFARLVKEHEPGLRVLAFRVVKCDQIAKDVVQDVFMKLWESQGQAYPIDNVKAWLYRVTENKLIDFLRKTSADKRLKQRTWGNIREMRNETEMNMAARESGILISKAVDDLPGQRKIIYQLNREQDLSYSEIAAVLGISRHTVKNQISSALHFLRDRLKNLRLF